MQLQLALDAPEHLALVPRLTPYFDIIEVGTPVLKRFGLAAIATARELSGGKPILADTKTADGGALEAEMVFSAGAAMMTVLAHASPATHADTVRVAAEHGAVVVFDTILGEDVDLTSLRGAADEPVWLALHAASDMRRAGHETTEHIERVVARRAAGYRVSLAGGIRRANFAAVLAVRPEIVVIGSGVTQAEDPEREAQWLRAQTVS